MILPTLVFPGSTYNLSRGCRDIRHKNTKQNDTQHDIRNVSLSISTLNADCCYAITIKPLILHAVNLSVVMVYVMAPINVMFSY